MKTFYTVFFTLLLVGCSESVKKEGVDIKSEVSRLIDDESKINYLERIYESDQSIREESKLIDLKYPRDSKENLEFRKSMIELDSLNLLKIEAYLNQYGYPSDNSFGYNATIAPILVVHHTMKEGVREKYFKMFHSAYLDGVIDKNFYAFYLGRMYQIKFGERMSSNSLSNEAEIAALIEAMGLEIN